jgi:hypothetical protein
MPNTNIWTALKNRQGNKIHISDNVIGAETDETHDGEPDGDDFGDYFAGRDGEEDGDGYEPVGEDAAEENLVPGWGYDFGFGRC